MSSAGRGAFLFGGWTRSTLLVQARQRLRDRAEAAPPHPPPTPGLPPHPPPHPPVPPHPPAAGRVDPPPPRHVAVIDAPEDLQPRVDALHRRPSLVQTLELLGGAADRRENPQGLRSPYAHHRTISPIAPLLIPARALAATPEGPSARLALVATTFLVSACP